jgi:hypothetical protein
LHVPCDDATTEDSNLSPTDFPFILVWWCFGLLFYSGGLLCIHAGGFPPYGLALPQGVMVFGQKEFIGFFSSQHFVVLNLGASRRDPLVPRESFENPHIIAHLFNVCRKVYFFPVWYVAFFSDFPNFRFSAISALLVFWLTDGAVDWVWKKNAPEFKRHFSPFVDFFLKVEIHLHLRIGQDHGVDLGGFDAIAVVAQKSGQFNFANLVDLICVTNSKRDSFGRHLIGI